MNNKDQGLERMTLEGLVKTLQILVAQRAKPRRIPLAAAQAELEAALAEARRPA